MELIAWAYTLGVLFGALGILAVLDELIFWFKIRRQDREAALRRNARNNRRGVSRSVNRVTR